jgi:hypothetical protein
MNDKLLLHKKINIQKQYIGFLKFLHPNFDYVEDLNNYYNPSVYGIIYIGKFSDQNLKKLKDITDSWIIVSDKAFDVDLTTNENLVKHLLPLDYIKINKTKESRIYNTLSYAELLDKVKICLLNNMPLCIEQEFDQSVFNLFAAVLGTPDILNYEFFNLVNKHNVSLITSSLLTFLNKVQSNNTKEASVCYARLITQSNKRYGKRIKNAILNFVRSRSNKEIALYKLLTDLNRSK